MAESVELSVERLGAGGDGIALWQGAPVYLPFTLPGDRVRARLGPPRGGGRAGRVVEWLAQGPGRIEPACPHFGACGGCALQHLDPAQYRAAKLTGLATALARIGVDPDVVAPIQCLPPARRRARLGLVRPRNPRLPTRLGFRGRFSHDLVDLRQCPVLAPELLATTAPLRDLGRTLLPPGGIADLTLTLCDSGLDLLIETASAPGLDALEGLAGFAAEHDLARIVWRAAGSDIPVVERRPARIVLSGVAVALPPGVFVQPVAAAQELMAAEVRAAIGPTRPALDLFSGLGGFAFALAGDGPVHAVEGDSRAAAELAAAAQQVPGVTVECRDLDRDPLPAESLAGWGAAVFDPPRAGAARQAAALAAAPLDTIVAVSCNPATFARDARHLVDGGFLVERLMPIDQFVWAAHLELVAVFRR